MLKAPCCYPEAVRSAALHSRSLRNRESTRCGGRAKRKLTLVDDVKRVRALDTQWDHGKDHLRAIKAESWVSAHALHTVSVPDKGLTAMPTESGTIAYGTPTGSSGSVSVSVGSGTAGGALLSLRSKRTACCC